jgi:hypothetical protein
MNFIDICQVERLATVFKSQKDLWPLKVRGLNASASFLDSVPLDNVYLLVRVRVRACNGSFFLDISYLKIPYAITINKMLTAKTDIIVIK